MTSDKEICGRRRVWLWAAILVGGLSLVVLELPGYEQFSPSENLSVEPDRDNCYLTCEVEVTESIPDNVTFINASLPRSIYDAWRVLIRSAKERINIAAYKSSLRGKHVLDQPSDSTALGEKIFDELVSAGRERSVNIRLIENYPAKDPGDNEDGKSLARRGVAQRQQLHYSELFGAGAMHSKFIVVDGKHLYLGSANLDWHSFESKNGVGCLCTQMPLFGHGPREDFFSYWNLTALQGDNDSLLNDMAMASRVTTINQYHPLRIRYRGALTAVYLAASPQHLNGPGRISDLDAILTAIENARKYIYVHVMDYIPMIVYREPHKYWPVIDDALRRAALDRGVEVKLLVAALHFVPHMLHFLKSLQALNAAAHPGSIQVRIFKVPAFTEFQSTIARERRTHNKFLVTESSAVIGTSNWSGDYFTSTTGVAFVVADVEMVDGKRPFIEQMTEIF